MFSISIKTNLSDVFYGIIITLEDLENHIDNYLLTASIDIRREMVERVRLYGINTSGVKMRTASPNKIGAYSAMYGLDRKNKGLTTDIMNMEYTGKMLSDFDQEKTGHLEYTIGMEDGSSIQKLLNMENYQGRFLDPTNELIQEIEERLENEIFDRVNQ